MTFEGVGHLIPMEVVKRTAEVGAGWLEKEIERWRKIEDVERREWKAMPMKEKSRLSKEHYRIMGDFVVEGQKPKL